MDYKDFCEDIAKKAGDIIKDNFSRPMNREWKKDDSPVTITDKEVNKLVISEVDKNYPGHDIRGEEESSMKNHGEYIWVCDPVDGTIPFSHGVPTAVFSLALVKEGVPIAGVVYDPWIDRLYYAEQGKGCFLNNQQVHVNKSNKLKLNVMGIATWKDMPYNLIKLYPILTNEGVKILNLNSIVYMGMLVASGELSGVFFGGDTCHDGAALKLIIEEAGGKFTDLFGNNQRYDSEIKGFIASNGILHDKLVEIVSNAL